MVLHRLWHQGRYVSTLFMAARFLPNSSDNNHRRLCWPAYQNRHLLHDPIPHDHGYGRTRPCDADHCWRHDDRGSLWGSGAEQRQTDLVLPCDQPDWLHAYGTRAVHRSGHRWRHLVPYPPHARQDRVVSGRWPDRKPSRHKHTRPLRWPGAQAADHRCVVCHPSVEPCRAAPVLWFRRQVGCDLSRDRCGSNSDRHRGACRRRTHPAVHDKDLDRRVLGRSYQSIGGPTSKSLESSKPQPDDRRNELGGCRHHGCQIPTQQLRQQSPPSLLACLPKSASTP